MAKERTVQVHSLQVALERNGSQNTYNIGTAPTIDDQAGLSGPSGTKRLLETEALIAYLCESESEPGIAVSIVLQTSPENS